MINLVKGGRVDLTKGTDLKKALIGLGWDTNRYDGNEDFDLDLVIFMCDANRKCKEENFIFYKNLDDPAKSVHHTGDNRTGVGDGDDESATVDLSKIPADVEILVIAVTIYDATVRRQNFGLVDNAFIRMENAETGEEILRYDLGEDFSIQKSVVFAEIYRSGAEWKFKAVGEGYDKELVDLCHQYGIETE